MEPSVQFDPGRCVLVLGPQIAAASLALNNDRELGPATTAAAAALSYAVLFESGMQKMLELDTSQSKEEKLRKQSLLAGAYELDPSFVANTVVESLRGHDKYEQWLTESFNSLYSLPVQNGQGSVIEELRQLQEKGVLLVYTYYDMILDKAMDTAPVLMDTDEDVKNWGSRKMSGILHVHGIHSHSSTVMCDCVNYGKIVGESSAGRRLREICRNRTVIFIGFDGRFYDPLLPKFANAFLHPSHAQSTAGLLLTVTGCPATNHPALLKLKLSTMSEGLSKFLIPTLSPYKPAPREGVDPSKSLNTTLLFADKSSCSDAAEKVKTMPAIKVHQLTISHEQQSHQLLLYLDHEGLRNLWKVLFSPENSSSSLMNSSLHNGLLGVVLDSGVTVWCKPGGNGNNSRLEGGSGSGSSAAGAMEVSSASSSHPTLSTAVSVIGSMWTPIATPSVVSQQQSLKQLVPSTSTRPTLPSPLITSHSSLGLNTKGLTPELPRHVGLLSPHSAHRREIREVRRVQSERSNLSYQDRINEMKASAGKRNGVLVHRESAPEFVYTSEGLIAYRADSISSSHHHHHSSHHHLRHHSPAAAAAAGGSGTQKPSSVSQPSPLVKDGSNLELKIEYIDQFQHGGSSSSSKSTGSGSHPSAIQKMVNPPSLSRGDGASAVERRGSEKRDVLPPGKFTEERQKFIREAMNWSKKVSTDIHKLSGTPSQQQQQQLSLNSSRSSLSLNTNISPEEQEKMLQQHFNLVKSQSQTKLALPAVSSVTSAAAVAAAAMSRLPLSSLASLSPSSGGQPQAQPRAIVMGTPAGVGGAQTPSKSPHPSPHPSPNLSPLQLASAIAANSSSMGGAGGGPSGSPKKSPVNPLLLGGTTGSTQPQSSSGNSSNIFSYFSSNPAAAAAAAALQSPAASFLYNPAVSQYAAAAAAMFNPFQAAVQLLSPQQQQQQQQQQTPGSNNKPPMLLTDPLILQNLQQSLPEKVPLILPDGSITLVPTNFGAAQTPVAAAQLPSATTVGGATATTSRESPVPSTMSLKSPNNVFGVSGSDLKRMRSPDDDPEVRPAPPKRRRSSSLPDIAQLSQLEMRGVQQESIREDEERENERGGEGNGSGSSKLSRPQMLMKQPQHRQTPPPNMIQIPHQDMKLNDPMLGFPTPPQSSPLIGNFAISPFVLSTPTFQNATPMTPVTPGQEPLSTEELRELVEASGGGQTNLPPSPEGTTLPPFPAGRGPIQLWQFLLDLLLSPDKQHMIQWTGNGYEFRILAPEDIAKLWGARKNKPRMNYDKLSRGLRYYYSKGIMDKVPGKKLTFKYTCDVQHYVRSRNIQAMRSSNFPNGGGGGTPTPTGPAGSAGNTIGGIVVGGVSSTHQATATTPLMPGGITIAASAVTVDDGSKPSPHQRLDSASLGSPEADDEREPMNLIMSQTSSMCNKSDTEYAT